MRISAKARYGLASMIYIAQKAYGEEQITISTIAEDLGISKIYLEQVFSLLRKAELVISIKGPQGGYKLSDSPDKIIVYDIIHAIEINLFEKTDSSVSDNLTEIDKAMENLVWNKLDEAIANALKKVSLLDLVDEAEKYKDSDTFMFYI